jgi:hypothetical protein
MVPCLRGNGAWIPAFAGMTEGNAGMTEGNTGMTERALFSQSPVIYIEFFCFFVVEHALNIHHR